MGTIKSANKSTHKIITNTGGSMISRLLSDCPSWAVVEMKYPKTSLLSRPSTDVKRNIGGRNILALAE